MQKLNQMTETLNRLTDGGWSVYKWCRGDYSLYHGFEFVAGALSVRAMKSVLADLIRQTANAAR